MKGVAFKLVCMVQYMVEDESMHSSEAQSLLSEKVKKKLKAQITEEVWCIRDYYSAVPHFVFRLQLYSKFSSADMIKLRHTEQKFEVRTYLFPLRRGFQRTGCMILLSRPTEHWICSTVYADVCN